MSNKGRVDGFATAATDPAVFNPAHSSVGAEGSLPLSAVRNPDCWGCAATGEQVSSAKRLVDAGCSSSIGLHPRRNGVKRRSSRPANSPPPPPSSPPPFLARRASQRETEPIRRKMSSCHGDGGATPSRIRQKVYKRERAPRVLVARTRHNSSNDDRAAFLVPPPTGPPPCIASPLGEDEGGQGVIKRRRNIATARLRRGDRCDGLYLACGRQQRGRRSDSSSSRSSSGNSNEAGGGCFGGSTSTNSSSSGEHGKTYLIFDDLARMDDAGEDKNSDRGSARKREAHGGDGRNNRRPSFGSQAGNSDNRKRATTSGWTKGKSTAQAAIRHGGESQSENESENDDGDESPGSNAYGRSSAHLSIKRGHKTRGSETTATPSPRDHPPGGSGPVVRETFVGKTLVDVVNEGVMGWLTGSSVAPDEAACRSGGHGGGLHSSGHRPTTTSSSATSLTFRQESTQSSLNNFDSASDGSDGTEIEDSATKCSRRSSGGGGFDKLSASGRALSSRKGESVAATKHHQSIALNERCGGAMDKKHSRSASKADVRQQGRRLLGKGSDGKRGGSHRDAVSRDDKAWPRHRPSSTHENEKLADDVVVHEGGSGTVHDDDDDGKCDNAACFRAEHSPTTTIDRGKDGQGTAAGHVSTAETKPRDAHGGWLAAREEKGGGEVRTCENGIASCDDDDASNDSLSDNIVSSKRRYRGNPEGMAVGRGSEDEGRRKDGDDGEASWRDVVKGGQTLARCNSLMLSYERGNNSDMVQCVIVRDRSGMNRLYPHYRFFFEGRGEQPAMVAHKCRKNRTSNYHIFDMKRGGFPTRLSKKNGNYLGKLRTNLKRVEATVFTNDKEVTELGAISFEKPGLVDHLREGSQPRKFSVLLPALDCDGSPVAHKVDPYDAGSDMLSRIKKGRHGNMFLLQSREPTYTNGNYRLNFHGRVTVPSVKNFQLVSPDDTLHTVCQFGKVGEDRFHLDYRAPINAFQAFCIALGQFNF